ncbi:N-formylglutamate amidohydrolase [Sphingomonas sp. BIUV-7]|uniref:N-formylglutamate amidohydrolase n=1 Tax=Sphingomonas natans TaxID=3063330 RepID=A0ABT8Y9X1_9SPHN|nr:N-formylglutamate amidohydrolase [Sphingomonas sp. BIUV-7]MDO6415129.1 N-formylglutamate amidohydrolase [Sphingomonas sp. BIUV-7]
MNAPWERIDGAGPMLLIADHASNRVPLGIDLGVPDAIMGEHVAIDIGVAPLGRALCARIGMAGILGNVSRLVIDLNREPDAAGLIPGASDGHVIAGNATLDEAGRADRIATFWTPYHAEIERTIAAVRPTLLISLHSFTPALREGGAPRPWEVGVLYNEDERAARIAIPLFEAAGIVTGDNQPYSGKVLNATMNRHGEGNGIPYLGLEVRQDLIGDEEGVAAWCDRLAPVIAATARALGASA